VKLLASLRLELDPLTGIGTFELLITKQLLDLLQLFRGELIVVIALKRV
jgi:hypothetical protein